MQIRNFGKAKKILEIPNLVDLQTHSYAEFLQADVPFNERKDVGLEAIIREIFPVKSYSGAMALEYIGYELGREHEQYSDTWVDWMFLMDESAFNDMTKGKGADDASA